MRSLVPKIGAIVGERWIVTLILILPITGFLWLGVRQIGAQETSLEDGHPRTVSAVAASGNTMISVSWEEPNLKWQNENGDRPGAYWVRYKLAGTREYYPDISSISPIPTNFAPNVVTSAEIGPCSDNDATNTGCIPIAIGNTYTVEVAQRTTGANMQTWPTGTDADWVQVYATVPYAQAAESDPRIEAFLKGTLPPFFRETGNDASGGMVVALSATPGEGARIELIWHELQETTRATADLDDFTFPEGNVADDFTWSSNPTPRAWVPIEIVDDGIVEISPELLYLRAANCKGISGPCPWVTSLSIFDSDTTTIGLAVSPSALDSTAITEQGTEIEFEATLTSPLDSRCELGWSLDLADNAMDSLTKLAVEDLVGNVEQTGVFVFEEGETRQTLTFTVVDDGVPEGQETSVLTLGDLTCENTYLASQVLVSGDMDGVLRKSIQIAASDLPVVDSVTPGDSNGYASDRLATVNWGLGSADEDQVSGFVVRWTEQVAGQNDDYYLTGSNVNWATANVDLASTRSGVFPSTGRLDAEKTYVVQVGVVTSTGADPLYSDMLSRVTTHSQETAPSSSTSSSTSSSSSSTVPTTLPPISQTTAGGGTTPTSGASNPGTATIPSVSTDSTAPSGSTTPPETAGTTLPQVTMETSVSVSSPTSETTVATETLSSAPPVHTTESTVGNGQTAVTQTPTTRSPTTQSPTTQTPNTGPAETQPSTPTSQTSPSQTVSTVTPTSQVPDTQAPSTQPPSVQPSTPPNTQASANPAGGGSGGGGVLPLVGVPTAGTVIQSPSTQPPSVQPSAPPNTQASIQGGVPNQPTGGGGGGVPPSLSGSGGGNSPSGTTPIGDTAQSPSGGFSDSVGTTHEANIDRLADGGITRGCNPPSNTRFCPGRAVTRGEMATFMVRAFNLAEGSSDLFGDDDGNTHESNINALAAAEITRGCNPPENSRYCPDRPVTRAQMATFLARAMDLAAGSGDFSDTGSSPHANDINRIASVGITRGCNPPVNSRFCPDRAVTRGEMATFLIRAEDVVSS